MNNLLTIPIFWQKVKVARKQLKMPQREVAEAVGVKQGQVSKMESGNQKHVQIALIKLMLKYGVNLNAMFDDSIDAGKFSEIIRHRGKAASHKAQTESPGTIDPAGALRFKGSLRGRYFTGLPVSQPMIDPDIAAMTMAPVIALLGRSTTGPSPAIAPDTARINPQTFEI